LVVQESLCHPELGGERILLLFFLPSHFLFMSSVE
jgi:hypothetical protein